MTPRSVVLLGSTGSIGTQAIDVLVRHPDRFRVTGLSAGGADPRALAQQAVALGAPTVAVADPDAAGPVLAAVADAAFAAGRPFAGIELLSGPDAAARLAARGADVVLNGITGSVGLGPTLAALGAGSTLALANKESLVVGGPLVADALQRDDQIVPVDSEHSAIAQALRSRPGRTEVRRLVLTASGGPFRGRRRDELTDITPAQALAHPTWSMGPVVTVNSATLMNKGLELIEAHLLFGVPTDDITVVVHPQSVVHSMVEFVDGSTIAQASPPDMRLPIALGPVLARPPARRRPAVRLDRRDVLDVRAARRGRVPGGRPRPARGGGVRHAPGGATTRRTSSASRPSSPAGSASSTSSTPWRRSSRSTTAPRPPG